MNFHMGSVKFHLWVPRQSRIHSRKYDWNLQNQNYFSIQQTDKLFSAIECKAVEDKLVY